MGRATAAGPGGREAGCSTSSAVAAAGGVCGGLEASGSGRGSRSTWACRCCTFAGNKMALLRCEVCNGLRQDGSGTSPYAYTRGVRGFGKEGGR